MLRHEIKTQQSMLSVRNLQCTGLFLHIPMHRRTIILVELAGPWPGKEIGVSHMCKSVYVCLWVDYVLSWKVKVKWKQECSFVKI